MKLLCAIFFLALLIRFLYFPNNINFAYDQARDSFAALDILRGDLKVLGPPTTAGGNIFHGALFYYILAPIYFLFNHNPEVAAALFRILNAIGVILVFYIGAAIFNKEVGLLAAFLYAISFEQSQYALFFGHPALGVFSVLIFYLGLTLWIFKNKPWGFIIALGGLGLSIQFEDANILLILNLVLVLLIWYRKIKLLNFKIILFSLLTLGVILSTFILSEVKYNFRMTGSLFGVASNLNRSANFDIEQKFNVLIRLVHDNFLANINLSIIGIISLTILSLIFLCKSNYRQRIIFLTIWFLGGMIPHLLNNSFTYYYSPAATVSLLIFVSFLIYWLYTKQKVVSTLLLGTLVFSNIWLITNNNYKGPGADIVIQPGMLTSHQRQVIDYIYNESNGEDFSANALTVPLNIKTTWDYLFNWYGRDRYGYTPVWGGEAADGFAGYLQVETDRSKLPDRRFTIIEPTIGIAEKQVEDFFRIENYFTKIIEEKRFGTITVQERQPI